ncbi:MAG: hypothetical protein WBE79_02350 [Candidatus Cybelea sp.]
MNSITAHRFVIGGLVVLLALAALKVFASCADGNPIHFRMTSYVPAPPAKPTPVSVYAEGDWQNGNISVPCIQARTCYAYLEYFTIQNPPVGTLPGCHVGSGESCLTINGPASAFAGTPPPFTVSSKDADVEHQAENVNGQFIVVFSSRPLTTRKTK